jgi:putative phosphoribosyl transferase
LDIPVKTGALEGDLQIPSDAKGLVVPRATHLFEEPGALEEVAKLALEWFREHFEKK